MHKCEGCKYRGEHQEMGFRAVGVCNRETDVLKATLVYNSLKCPYTEGTESAQILKSAINRASTAYATHLMFGGNADPGEEAWLDALDEAVYAILSVEELMEKNNRLKAERDSMLAQLRAAARCEDCKYYCVVFDESPCVHCLNEERKPRWRWSGDEVD